MQIVGFAVLILTVLTTSVLTQTGRDDVTIAESNEYCSMDTMNVTCPGGHVIMMQSAMYGRMAIGRCVREGLGYLGCKSDALSILDTSCTGRRFCSVHVPNPQLHELMPCPADTTAYLQANHACVKVAMSSRAHCRHNHNTKLTSSEGYISSEVTKSYRVGADDCPWIIEAKAGQRVSISIFNLDRMEPSPNGACLEFARLKDGRRTEPLTSCLGNGRLNEVYRSHGPRLEVIFVNPTILSTQPQYLIHYRVVGCADVPSTRDMSISRHGDRLTLTCNTTRETWYLTCDGNAWSGKQGNCSQIDGTSVWSFGTLIGDDKSFPFGILLIVAIGVALGVFVGGVLLAVVAFYMKRNQQANGTNSLTSPREGDSSLSHKAFTDGDTIHRDWNTNAKYYVTDDLYHQQRPAVPAHHTVSASLDRSVSGGPVPCGGRQPGFEYRVPTDDSAYYDEDTGTSAPSNDMFRHHVYESPQFT